MKLRVGSKIIIKDKNTIYNNLTGIIGLLTKEYALVHLDDRSIKIIERFNNIIIGKTFTTCPYILLWNISKASNLLEIE